MRKLVRSVEINAPVDRVYEFMTTPTNLPSIWPNLISVGNVQRSTDGANSFDWTYKMAGLHFRGHSRPLDVKKNELIVTRNDEGVPSTFRWMFQPKGAQTKLTVEIEYAMPVPVVGKIAEAFMAKVNEHDIEAMLRNAKASLEAAARLEATSAAPAPH